MRRGDSGQLSATVEAVAELRRKVAADLDRLEQAENVLRGDSAMEGKLRRARERRAAAS